MRALALVRDLLFRSKIDAVARAAGADVSYVSTIDAARVRCAELKPAVVFVDLSDLSFPSANVASELRASGTQIRIVGYASHVDLKALKSAREAGFDLTLSREEFTSRLPELLKS